MLQKTEITEKNMYKTMIISPLTKKRLNVFVKKKISCIYRLDQLYCQGF